MPVRVKHKFHPLPTVRDLIKMYKIRAEKQLAQNFLLCTKTNRRIVNAAGKIKNNYIFEVGPGPGGITRAILEKNVLGLTVVEKDKRFLPGLELIKDTAKHTEMEIFIGDILSFNMNQRFPDELKEQWEDGLPKIKILGNLPFNISTGLILKWLEDISNQNGAWSYGRVPLTLTFQKEVAQRLAAPINSKFRSRLSVMSQYLCDVNHVYNIPAEKFRPKPEVDAGVVNFVPKVEPLIKQPYPLVEKVVRHVFHYRQKRCQKSISTLFPPDQTAEYTQEMIRAAEIDDRARPFQLAIEQYAQLCEKYSEICQHDPLLRDYDYRSPSSAAMRREFRHRKREEMLGVRDEQASTQEQHL
ncbi:mitochondrial dimethyladenosine transferase 1-like [Lingula anatina]|uniref:rRNA adenine N(6)-methyltransferase n=1 Tax=Lingula anatina TaxID=7574 RepID=A0A1S3H4I0_LINAN|nr:mitochondrial dimethyladenosine transferase 1-like [Lingula anatina]|eukprot:XP_013380044.1 mitochondrial dimethyladenosine transferase 1-like [Lingula anatina]